MKAQIHPQWYPEAVVTCSCGNTFTTGSTKSAIQVDICSACHPFFTGEMKFVDRQGRVDKFIAKIKNAQAKQAQTKTKAAKKKPKEAKSYQQILVEQKKAIQQAKTTAPAVKN